MIKITVFAIVIFFILLTASCASAPDWSGAETAAGEFVWSPSPGFRFYANVVLLGGVFVYFIYAVFRTIRNRQKGDGGVIGCLSLFVLFTGFILFANIRDNIWNETFSINQDRIERKYYTTVWKTNKQTETLEWKNVKYIGYNPQQFLESTTWVKVNPVTRERVGRGQTETGVKGRVIHFSENDAKNIVLILERQSYDSSYPEFILTFFQWIFGTENYNVSPEEEARLKAAINKFMPENLKEKMSPETKAYFAGEQ